MSLLRIKSNNDVNSSAPVVVRDFCNTQTIPNKIIFDENVKTLVQ